MNDFLNIAKELGITGLTEKNVTEPLFEYGVKGQPEENADCSMKIIAAIEFTTNKERQTKDGVNDKTRDSVDIDNAIEGEVIMTELITSEESTEFF